jgi:peptidoglycan pentaglycine glycine transferase (the first glycine)
VNARQWDTFVRRQGGHLLQTTRWGKLKGAFGWEYETDGIMSQRGIEGGALILFRRLPLGLGTVAYVPRGPVVRGENEDILSSLLYGFDSIARRHRAVLLKIEPDWPDTPQAREQLTGLGFRPSPHTVQPARTIVLDVRGSEDDILARMNQGTRRKIRLSARKGVKVRRGDAGDLDSFNALMAATGERDAFGVHSPAYYRRAYELFAPRHAALLMASYEGRDLGGVMVFRLGKRAWYLYGASSNEERSRMPTYGLQWEAIRWAREGGCTTYDMWGVPDEDEETLEAQFQERQDGLWGVYGFKRGFGGRVVRTVGAWDRVYRPVLYAVYKAAVARRAGIGE